MSSIEWVGLKCSLSGVASCLRLRGWDIMASDVEQSVPEGNVEKSAAQGVRAKQGSTVLYTW